MAGARRVGSIVLGLLLLGWPAAGGAPRAEVVPRTELSHPCSRAVARQVRKTLEKDVLRPAQKAGTATWPKGCPLDPAVDLWGRHERQKQRKRGTGTQWTCGFDGKTFKSEHYLDLHLERRHMNETPAGGVCLADYCDMFDVCNGDSRYQTYSKRRKDDLQECSNASMLQARHRCEDAMMRCFPLDNEAARTLYAQFSKTYCRVLDCRIQEEKKQVQSLDFMPVIVLIILIALICFIVFSIVVCCVDYSDDIFQFMVESGLASQGMVKKMTQTREVTKQKVGMDRTKCI